MANFGVSRRTLVTVPCPTNPSWSRAFQRVGNNDRLCPPDATAWDVFGRLAAAPDGAVAEKRELTRLFFVPIGTPLPQLATPDAVISAVIDAVIGTIPACILANPCLCTCINTGHYIYLLRHKILHRDVSEGNVLGLDEPWTARLDDHQIFNE